MGIAADIVEFFYTPDPNHPLVEGLPEFRQFGLPEPKLLGQFMLHANNFNRSEILPVIQQLIAQAMLIPTGRALEGSPPMNETYYSPKYCPDSDAYGIYDFATSGFPTIYNQFKDSVQAVVVTKENEDPDIGSGFLLRNRMFVTARHCIQGMKKIEITGWNPDKAPLLNIFIPVEENIDLAILKFKSDPFPGIPGFLCREAKILDNILTMGYPPLPGFDKVLVAEKGQVAGHLKSTTGQIVTEEKSYLDQQDYLLISARVKGGNSGGPVITDNGCVTGVISQLLAEGDGRADILGYAAAIPFKTLKLLIDGCSNALNSNVKNLPFQVTKEGFVSTFL